MGVARRIHYTTIVTCMSNWIANVDPRGCLNIIRADPRILRYKSARLLSEQDAKLREKLAAEKGWKQDISNQP
ncbi:hypothetical protein AAC978_00450 [Desulfitobacterium sp. THU1]